MRRLLFIGLFALFAFGLPSIARAQCASPCLQSVNGGNVGIGDTATIVMGSNTSGSSIVVRFDYCNGAACGNDITGCVSPTVTDTHSQTYTLRELVQVSFGRWLAVFTTQNIASGSNTVTFHASCPGAGDAAYYVGGSATEFTAAASSFDTSGQATGNSAAPAATTGTTSNANDIVWGSVVPLGGGPTVGGGFSSLTSGYDEFKTVSSTGAKTADWTAPSGDWAAIAVAIKQAGGGGGATTLNRRTFSPRTGTRTIQ